MISAEFGLLAECCRRAFAGGNGRSFRQLAAAADWGRFARLARFHRVQGLVWSCLSKRKDAVPADVAGILAADATYIAAASLRASIECRELVAELDTASIPFLFLKGLTLGVLAYGNPALKAAVDIDLLVAPDSIGDVASLLKDRGYHLQIPKGRTDPQRLRTWHIRRKESLWSRTDQGLHVDLHSRASDNPRLIPDIDVRSPRQTVAIAPGIVLPTLAKDELFAYLCVHGASSAWFRLKWISDFAAMIDGLPASEIERLYERSQELGAGRAAGQALLLAHRLFGPNPASDLMARLQTDRGIRWLAGAAFRQLARSEPREPTATRLGTWRIHLTQFLLKPGLRFKLSELSRQIGGAIL